MKNILVTNDDGINARGIKILAGQLETLGNVWVIAPDSEKSTCSHSMSLGKPVRVEKIGDRIFAVEGTPTDCVVFAVRLLLRSKPDLIISGINRGFNLGDDVTYSGTVAGALEGSLMGIPSFAVSIDAGKEIHFETAAHFALRLGKIIFKKGLPAGSFLNVNVPNLPMSRIQGAEITTQGKRIYRDKIRRVTNRGSMYYWITDERRPGWKNEDGSDFSAIARGKISVTPLCTNLTDKRWSSKTYFYSLDLNGNL